MDFDLAFRELTGVAPFPWQHALFEAIVDDPPHSIPQRCNLPTGLGKTSVVAIWLIALATCPRWLPRRLVYVVNRRTVVDQTTVEVERLRANLLNGSPELQELRERVGGLAISTLRGQFADNREWSADPSRPAVIVGTVDMIGSRLLFSGYGVGPKLRPLHAGFLGQDSLLVHDEAHLEPAFQRLLERIAQEQTGGRYPDRWPMQVMELTATSRSGGGASVSEESIFTLTPEEQSPPDLVPNPPQKPVQVVWRRQKARKQVHLHELADENKLAETVAGLATQRFAESGRAILIFVQRVEDVAKVVDKLPKGTASQQLTGTMRGLERDTLFDPRHENGCPVFARFLRRPPQHAEEREQWKVEPREGTVYLICTSAGEVGVNLSADHLICDLSTFESMAQRFGRVNRFGDCDDTEIHVVHPHRFGSKPGDDQRRRTLELLKKLDGDASPLRLGQLDEAEKAAAFSPPLDILTATDILFDAWAMTSIGGRLPGRPPVEPYLHGQRDWDPPETPWHGAKRWA